MLENIQIKFLPHYKILREIWEDKCLQLRKATDGSSGYDIFPCIEHSEKLWPNQSKLYPTGVAIFINDKNWEAQIRPRSGKGSKGLVIGNLTGTIDSDYQGELLVCLWNRTDNIITISPLEAVAQLVFCPVGHPKFKVIEEFSSKSSRGKNGFGHTDKKGE